MKMKPTLLLLIIVLGVIAVVCINFKSIARKVETMTGNFVNVYEYEYEYNTPDLVENHYIKVESKKGKLTGWYYGTSDDFDEGREGYWPGFFVKKMDDLKITDRNISFTLHVNDKDMVRKPVRLQYNSKEELPKTEYKKWGGDRDYPSRKYRGIIKDNQIIFEFDKQKRIFNKKEPSGYIKPYKIQYKTNIVVSPQGSSEHQTNLITKALESAAPGAMIRVQPGTYYEEYLTIDQPVTIIGEGKPNQVIIQSTITSCITSTADHTTLKNLTIHCMADEWYGIDISSGNLTIENCNIISDDLTCLSIRGAKTNLVIKNCNIHQGKNSYNESIKISEKAQGTILNCKIYGSNASGIRIETEGYAKVSGCEIFSNKEDGIFLDNGGQGAIDGCKIYGNKLSGIKVRESSNSKISNCKIYENRTCGVEIYEGGNSKISWCEIYNNSAAGILVEQGLGIVSQCQIYSNKLSGFEIRNYGNPNISGCKIYNSEEGNGVYVYEQGRGTIADCKIYGNNFAGISISKDGNTNISGCEIYNNLDDGVYVFEQGQGIITDCKIYGNKASNVESNGGGIEFRGENEM